MTTQVQTEMLADQAVTQQKLALGAVPQIQPVTAAVASNALTLTLNPTVLDFRSATLGSGTVNTRSVAAAVSVVIPTSATLGTVSTVAARLVLVAIDNAGTVELGVANIAGGFNLDETTLISTTAISASATANNVVYSTTARTSVPFRVVGYVDITEATAGTWATAPSTIQGSGGQAADSMGSLGFGQTWQVVTRTSGTTYYNTTGRPIMLSVRITSASGLRGQTDATINGTLVTIADCYGGATAGGFGGGSIIIPPGASYVLTDTTVSVRTTSELR